MPLELAPRTYGKSAQIPTKPDDSPELKPEDKKLIERVVGSFLYYGRAVDNTTAHTLSVIASEQANPTKNKKQKVIKLFYYMATNPHATI